MPTLIFLFTTPDQGVLAKETYATVKRRLFDSRKFMEVTDPKGKKILFNKQGILIVTPAVPKPKGKKVKNGPKKGKN